MDRSQHPRHFEGSTTESSPSFRWRQRMAWLLHLLAGAPEIWALRRARRER